MNNCVEYGLAHRWQTDEYEPRLEWCPNCGSERAAQGIEAASAAKTPKSGLAVGESPVPKGCAQKRSDD